MPAEILSLDMTIEGLLEESLSKGKLSSKHIEVIREYIHLYEIEVKKLPHDQIKFLEGRLESFKKQLIFLINAL